MECDDLLEELETLFASFRVREVGEWSVATKKCQSKFRVLQRIQKCSTHGQDMMETIPIPMTMALLTLKAIKNATNMPPMKMPIHICNQMLANEIKYLGKTSLLRNSP